MSTTVNSIDRASIIDNSLYLWDHKKEPHDINSSKNWWLIGILIGFFMNFIAFVVFYVFHKREYLKQVYSKT